MAQITLTFDSYEELVSFSRETVIQRGRYGIPCSQQNRSGR